MFILGIDTCGPSGSVALSSLAGSSAESLAHIELAGRTYAATLVSAIEDLLKRRAIRISDLGCIVVVSGPGSFTGVRVGLSAAKGLSEGAGVPMAAISRLEVLAAKAGVRSAVLDAHRHEVYLRLDDPEEVSGGGESLATVEDLARINPPPEIAVCDEAAAALLRTSWEHVTQVLVAPPTAVDALSVAAPVVAARNFADAALLDGHYLRRSDAEIFGTPPGSPSIAGRQWWVPPAVKIRPMRTDDISRAMGVAAGLPQAPHWPADAYARALDPGSLPPRVALVAELPGADIAGFLITMLIPPRSELETIAVAKEVQRQGTASALFNQLLSILEEQKVTEVMLEVRASNQPARAFYAALGFNETGRRAGYYAEPKEDAILLSRPVP